jgi:hypothetical protein
MATRKFLRQNRLLERIQSFLENDFDSFSREDISDYINVFEKFSYDFSDDETLEPIIGHLSITISTLYLARKHATPDVPRNLVFYESLESCRIYLRQIMRLGGDTTTDAPPPPER